MQCVRPTHHSADVSTVRRVRQAETLRLRITSPYCGWSRTETGYIQTEARLILHAIKYQALTPSATLTTAIPTTHFPSTCGPVQHIACATLSDAIRMYRHDQLGPRYGELFFLGILFRRHVYGRRRGPALTHPDVSTREVLVVARWEGLRILPQFMGVELSRPPNASSVLPELALQLLRLWPCDVVCLPSGTVRVYSPEGLGSLEQALVPTFLPARLVQ